jgi:hypothetical protein
MLTEAQTAVPGAVRLQQSCKRSTGRLSRLLFLMYRSKLGALFDVIAQRLKEAKHVRAGNFENEAAEAINQVANQAGQSANAQANSKGIRGDQIEAARLMGKRLNAVPMQLAERWTPSNGR